MWQLYILGSLLATSCEEVIDKAAIVRNKRIDISVASFIRCFLYVLITFLIGLTGWFGTIHLSFGWLFLALALMGICNSLFSTYLLKKIEITSDGAISYAAPLLYILIDTVTLHVSISALQIFAIVLLIVGGLGFSIDHKTNRFKKEFTPRVWGIFLFGLLYGGAQAYLFKYAVGAYHINSISLLVSVWFMVSIGLLTTVIARGKLRRLFTGHAFHYAWRETASKTLDAAGSLLWVQALVLTSVSQTSAMDALYPLLLFIVAFVAQRKFKLHLDERLSRSDIIWKSASLVFLIGGSLLVK